MAVRAIAKGIRISPRKVSSVAALVRGRTVSDALVILNHTPRGAALPVKKVIESARANADYNHDYKADSLFIKTISVSPGVRYKRHRPVARGQTHPFQLKTTHIYVEVDGEKRPAKKTESAKKPTPEKETK